MFKKSFAALSIASLALLNPVYSEEKEKGVYFVGAVGLGQMADIDIASSIGGGKFEFDSGFSGDIGIGYDFGSIRTELTYNSTNTDLSVVQGTAVDIGVDVSSFFLSAAYDWRSDKKWQPYVGAGIGSSEISVNLAKTVGDVNLTVGDDNITSVIARLGVNYKASENIDLYGEGWVQAFDDFTIGAIQFYDCGMTGASIGLRVKL